MDNNNAARNNESDLVEVEEEDAKFDRASFMVGILVGMLGVAFGLFITIKTQELYYGFTQRNSIVIGSGNTSISSNSSSVSINNNNGMILQSNDMGSDNNIVRLNVLGNSSNTIINTDDSIITTVNGRTTIRCKKNIVVKNNSNVTTISKVDCDDE